MQAGSDRRHLKSSPGSCKDADMRSPRTALLPVAVGLGLLLVILLLVPPLVSADRSMFVNIGELLSRGNLLYVEVSDNKDPLFFYSLAALSPLFGAGSSFVLEIVCLAVSAIALYGIAAFLTADDRQSHLQAKRMLLTVASFGVLCWPAFYLPGLSTTPGSMMALLAVWASCRNRFVLAGIATGLLIFLKPAVFPVAALMVVTLLLMINHDNAARVRAATRTTLGGGVSVLVGVVGMALLGILPGWWDMLSDNASYSRDGLAFIARGTSRLQLFLDQQVQFGVAMLLALLLVLAAAAVYSVMRVRASAESRRTHETAILLAAGLGICTAGIVLSLTYLWSHHGQLIALPAALFVMAALSRLKVGLPLVAAGVLLGLAPLLVPLNTVNYLDKWESFTNPATEQLASTTVNAASNLPNVSYTFAGINTAGGLVEDLPTSWSFVCRQLAVWPWSSEEVMAEYLTCLETVPNVAFWSDIGVRQYGGVSPRFDAFNSDVESILQRCYEGPVTQKHISPGRVQAFIRRAC